MSEFKCLISLRVIHETKEMEFLRRRHLPFVPQSGMSLQLLGMDFESKIVHVGYVESEDSKPWFDVSLTVQNLNQHQIDRLTENGWRRSS